MLHIAPETWPSVGELFNTEWMGNLFQVHIFLWAGVPRNSWQFVLSSVVLALCWSDKLPKRNNFQRRRAYFVSCFQRLQSRVSWLCCSSTLADIEHPCRSVWWRKLLAIQQAGSEENKGPGPRVHVKDARSVPNFLPRSLSPSQVLKPPTPANSTTGWQTRL